MPSIDRKSLRDNGSGGGVGGCVGSTFRCAFCPCITFVRWLASLSTAERVVLAVALFLVTMNVWVDKDASAGGGGGSGKTSGLFHSVLKTKLGWNDTSFQMPSMPKINTTGVGGLLNNLRGAPAADDDSPSGSDGGSTLSSAEAAAAATPSPTLAPTEPTQNPEDPAAVAAALVKGEDPQRPTECTDATLDKVRSSGMEGSSCRGQPFTQACAFSQLTKVGVPSWLDGFLEEVRDLRKEGADAEATTFVGALLGPDCGTIEQRLRVSAHAEPEQVVADVTKKPKLFCEKIVKNDVTQKWGLDKGAVDLSNLDQHLHKAGVREDIKDVVMIAGGESSVKSVKNGMATVARARYIELDYDWRDGWKSTSLKDIMDALDKIHHTCYWAGQSKLWRVTGCWQEFYGFKSWSHLACANRNLAPKLAKRMEDMFLKTIGEE